MEKTDLVDLREVNVNTDVPPSQRIADYLIQIKNPYHFRVDDIEVKVSFCGESDFRKTFYTALANGINYR